MPNPVITPYGGDAAVHTVTQSDNAYYDLEITDLTDDAEFTMTVPANTVLVDVWTLTGAEATIRWNPNGIEQPLLAPDPGNPGQNIWTNQPVIVGPWTVNVSAAAVTDPVVIIINGPGPVGSLRLRARNLAGAQVSLQAQSDTRTVRITADPSIIGTPAPDVTPVVERTNRTMQGNPQVTVQASGMVPAALATLPVVRGLWEKVSANPTFSLVQASPNATFTVPGIYADTPFTFRFRAYYDLNTNNAFDATEPETSEDVNVTFMAVRHRMVLVLDRSGSMSSSLPGGTESRWDASKRAAHIWLDLFAAFRAPENQTAGVITFEDDSCGYPAPALPADVTFVDPSTGLPAAGLSVLSSFSTLTGLNLGTPQTCTPIGDALKRAFTALDAPPLTDLDAATILLLTDGYENSGAVSIKGTLPPGTTSVASNLPATLQSKLALYVMGCGDSVDQDALDNLTNLTNLDLIPGGYYGLAPKIEDILPFFAEMLGHSVDAQDLGAVLDGTLLFATFATNAGETRLSVVVPWDQPSHSLRLSRRDPGAMAWTPVSIGANATLLERDTHAMINVDLPGLLGSGSPAQEWRIEWINGAEVAQPLKFGVLAIVDLHCKMDIEFDKTHYGTGETIRVTARLNAGNEVITNATVIAEVAGPGEGLGSFMSSNGGKMGGPITLRNLKEGQLIEALRAASQGPDPNQPKGALFNIYLQANGMSALPVVNPVFVDATDRMFDDGAHSDGAANDGVYANNFDRTDKEGTYTFRFRAEGTLPGGSQFRRVITISKWIGVRVDPASSPTVITSISNPPPGMVGQLIVVTPRDKKGEFLGPFREGQVKIEASAGGFTGPVESRLDGSYERTLIYRRDEKPKITITVDDQQVFPRPLGPEGCLQAIIDFLKKLMFWK